MSERLSLAVIERLKGRVHAFVTDDRKRLKGCHHNEQLSARLHYTSDLPFWSSRALFQQIIGVTGDKKPTLVWSAEATVVAPAVAVARVQDENIAEYMG
jgi:hypothetical protein